jgi:hypothetical protein
LIDLLLWSKIDSVYDFSSEVQAAYLEVVNLIWAHQHRKKLPFSTLSLSTSSQAGGALERKQRAISMAYLTLQQHGDKLSSLRKLLQSGTIGADTTVAVLEVVPDLWQAEEISSEELIGLSEMYIGLCKHSSCKEVQAQSILNLAEVLDRLLLRNVTDVLAAKLSELWTSLPLMSMNPFFANAVTRASGGVMASLSRTGTLGGQGLSSWGQIMAEAGREDKVSNILASQYLCKTNRLGCRTLTLAMPPPSHSAHTTTQLPHTPLQLTSHPFLPFTMLSMMTTKRSAK